MKKISYKDLRKITEFGGSFTLEFQEQEPDVFFCYVHLLDGEVRIVKKVNYADYRSFRSPGIIKFAKSLEQTEIKIKFLKP